MSERTGTRGARLGRVAVASVVTITLAVAAVSCGDDDQAGSAGDQGAVATDAAGGTDTIGDPTNGEQLSRSKGCAGCHGQDFGGGAGPSWIDLAGSEVTLVDGSTVVADSAYLIRAIADPSADLVADYNLKMPANSLSDAEIADIVAFIETLADG